MKHTRITSSTKPHEVTASTSSNDRQLTSLSTLAKAAQTITNILRVCGSALIVKIPDWLLSSEKSNGSGFARLTALNLELHNQKNKATSKTSVTERIHSNGQEDEDAAVYFSATSQLDGALEGDETQKPNPPDDWFDRAGLDRRSSSGDSLSSSHAREFVSIHYQAAIRLVEDLTPLAQGSTQQDQLIELQKQLSINLQRIQAAQPTATSRDVDAIRSAMGGKYKTGKPTDLLNQFAQEQTRLVRLGASGADIPDQLKHVHIRTALASFIHGRLLAVGLPKSDCSIRRLDTQLFDKYVDLLQSRRWDTIVLSNELAFPMRSNPSASIAFTTKLTPASKLGPSLEKSYRADGVNGICSYANKENRHAVNLWQTRFGPDQMPSGTARFEFTALRHGVHDAFGIKVPQERAQANDARVSEFLQAALISHMEKNKLNLEDVLGKEAIELNIVSVNLLTDGGKESAMIKHQREAFERFDGKTTTLELIDGDGTARTVKAKPRVIEFNTPVNKIALSPIAPALGIWRVADKVNKAGLEKLLGSTKENDPIGGLAGAELDRLAAALSKIKKDRPCDWQKTSAELAQKSRAIKTLVEQIRETFNERGHHRVGREPYKLPVRILALANECGATPAFNCKSGKDRTGQLNVEVRDFYAQLNANAGKPRDLDVKRDGPARNNYMNLFTQGGDREIQALNTGAIGSKSQLPYYNKLMGVAPKTIDEIKGLSRWVGT